MKQLLSLLISALLISLPVNAADVGKPLPAYLGKTLAGEPIFPQNFAGRVVLISFWASWCAPCNRELPYLKRIQAKWGSDKVQVLAINQYEDDEAFASEKEGFKDTEIMQARDRKGIISQMFGVDGIPHTLVVDKAGKVAHIHSGFYPDTGEQMLAEVEALLQQ